MYSYLEALLVVLVVAFKEALAESNCKAVTFTVSASAQNKNITGVATDSTASIKSFLAAAPSIAISGSQTIAATYCTATISNDNNSKLQFLSGRITSNRAEWQAQGGVGSDFPAYKPELYSWSRFANAQGYPTLAIDRLGTGKSSHPDPMLVVQAPYEQALYNDLARQLRAGAPEIGGTKYNYVAYVGNSYGSQLGTGIAGTFPDAFSALILTGYTSSVAKGFAGVAKTSSAPAKTVDPARFGSLPEGYLTTSSKEGRTNSFFGSRSQVDYDDTVADLFFARKDVVAVGQFVSVYGHPFNGAGFTGRVLVLDGEEDQAFCRPGSPVIGPAYCGSQLKETGTLFPDAQFNYKSVNRMGHAVQLHIRSQTLFSIAHQFLDGKNFTGGTPA